MLVATHRRGPKPASTVCIPPCITTALRPSVSLSPSLPSPSSPSVNQPIRLPLTPPSLSPCSPPVPPAPRFELRDCHEEHRPGALSLLACADQLSLSSSTLHSHVRSRLTVLSIVCTAPSLLLCLDHYTHQLLHQRRSGVAAILPPFTPHLPIGPPTYPGHLFL